VRRLLVAMAVLLCARHAAADVAADKQALIVLRILAYDGALAARTRDVVRIGVVHSGAPDSLGCASRMRKALAPLVGRVTVLGMPIAVSAIPASGIAEAMLRPGAPQVLYVCEGAADQVAAIARAARGAGALTFTSDPSLLERGLSIALTEGEGRVAIHINLVAARAEGAKLGSQLLRLSKVIKR
jgi:hypothetical protein